MDLVTSIEPQLVIPVVCTVALAFLVYLFGFQKTQEPSFQHIAVLQSSSKPRSISQSKSSNTSGGNTRKDKVVANGHVLPVPKGSKSNVSAVAGGKADKENQKPQTTPKILNKKEKKVVEKDEELDAGDWTSVSRKDKKTKPTKKEVVEKPRSNQNVSNSASNPNTVSEGEMLSIEQVMKIAAEAKAAASGEKETVLKEVVEKVETPAVTQTKPAVPEPEVQAPKKTKESKPKNKGGNVPAPTPVENRVIQEEEKPLKIEEPVQLVKETNNKQPKGVEETNNNVAFDEMGDLWEEAKSRGNKKKARARRD